MKAEEEFLNERNLKPKDWYGTAQNGDIQELDLVELLESYRARIMRKKIYQDLKEIRELKERIDEHKKTFERVRNFLANTKVNDAAGEDEKEALFYAVNEYLRP